MSTAPTQVLMQTLSQEPRVDILRVLVNGPCSADQIAQRLSCPDVQGHLNAMADKGILDFDGKQYALSDLVNVVQAKGRCEFSFYEPDGTGFSFSMPTQ